MKEETARSTLKLIGVATTLVGAILTLQTVILRVAFASAMESKPAGITVQATGMMGEFGNWAILAQAIAIVLGVAVWFMSPMLARHVTDPR